MTRCRNCFTLIHDGYSPAPVPAVCPKCGAKHVDREEPENGWTNPPHKSHKCRECSLIWRPADFATVGVEDTKTIGVHDTVRCPRAK